MHHLDVYSHSTSSGHSIALVILLSTFQFMQLCRWQATVMYHHYQIHMLIPSTEGGLGCPFWFHIFFGMAFLDSWLQLFYTRGVLAGIIVGYCTTHYHVPYAWLIAVALVSTNIVTIIITIVAIWIINCRYWHSVITLGNRYLHVPFSNNRESHIQKKLWHSQDM